MNRFSAASTGTGWTHTAQPGTLENLKVGYFLFYTKAPATLYLDNMVASRAGEQGRQERCVPAGSRGAGPPRGVGGL